MGNTIVNLTKRISTTIGKNGEIVNETVSDLKSNNRFKDMQKKRAERLGIPWKE